MSFDGRRQGRQVRKDYRPSDPARSSSFFKYGEEYYSEASIPACYFQKQTDSQCNLIVTNFLIYNKRGDRQQSIEKLNVWSSTSVAGPTLLLYGLLLPLVCPDEIGCVTQGATPVGKVCNESLPGSTSRRTSTSSTACSRRGKKRGATSSMQEKYDRVGLPQPYPVRVELNAYQVDLSPERNDSVNPILLCRKDLSLESDQPSITLLSLAGNRYRLGQPANRYAPFYFKLLRKYILCYRALKCIKQAATFSHFMYEMTEGFDSLPDKSMPESPGGSCQPITSLSTTARFTDGEIFSSYDFVHRQLSECQTKSGSQNLLNSELMKSYKLASMNIVTNGVPIIYAVIGLPVFS